MHRDTIHVVWGQSAYPPLAPPNGRPPSGIHRAGLNPHLDPDPFVYVVNAQLGKEFPKANLQGGLHVPSDEPGNNRRGRRGENPPRETLEETARVRFGQIGRMRMMIEAAAGGSGRDGEDAILFDRHRVVHAAGVALAFAAADFFGGGGRRWGYSATTMMSCFFTVRSRVSMVHSSL